MFNGYKMTNNTINEVALDYHWDSYGGGTSFLVIPGKSLLEGNFAYSYYKVVLEETDKMPRTSSIGGFNGGFKFTYFFGKNALKYGIDVAGYKTVFDFFNSVNRQINYTQNTTDIDFYIDVDANGTELVIVSDNITTRHQVRLGGLKAGLYAVPPTGRICCG